MGRWVTVVPQRFYSTCKTVCTRCGSCLEWFHSLCCIAHLRLYRCVLGWVGIFQATDWEIDGKTQTDLSYWRDGTRRTFQWVWRLFLKQKTEIFIFSVVVGSWPYFASPDTWCSYLSSNGNGTLCASNSLEPPKFTCTPSYLLSTTVYSLLEVPTSMIVRLATQFPVQVVFVSLRLVLTVLL